MRCGGIEGVGAPSRASENRERCSGRRGGGGGSWTSLSGSGTELRGGGRRRDVGDARAERLVPVLGDREVELVVLVAGVRGGRGQVEARADVGGGPRGGPVGRAGEGRGRRASGWPAGQVGFV
jgi:hypothetical protein